MHTFTHSKNTNSHYYLKHLKTFFLKVAPTCFGPYLRPSSGGLWAVLYAVTKLNSGQQTVNYKAQHVPIVVYIQYTSWWWATNMPETCRGCFFFILYFQLDTAFLSTFNICYPLSSTCFRPHRPIIRRSKLYMQPMVFSPSADVFVLRPLRKNSLEFFLNGRTTKTSAEGENTIGCMYNLDLLMMGLWGLKHVEERG